MKRHILEDPIFFATILLQVGGTRQSAADWLFDYISVPHETIEKEQPWSNGAFISMTGCKCGVLWLKDEQVEVAALTHEAWHATHHIMDCLELPIARESKEIVGYYIEWLMRKILNKLTRKRRA